MAAECSEVRPDVGVAGSGAPVVRRFWRVREERPRVVSTLVVHSLNYAVRVCDSNQQILRRILARALWRSVILARPSQRERDQEKCALGIRLDRWWARRRRAPCPSVHEGRWLREPRLSLLLG